MFDIFTITFKVICVLTQKRSIFCSYADCFVNQLLICKFCCAINCMMGNISFCVSGDSVEWRFRVRFIWSTTCVMWVNSGVTNVVRVVRFCFVSVYDNFLFSVFKLNDCMFCVRSLMLKTQLIYFVLVYKVTSHTRMVYPAGAFSFYNLAKFTFTSGNW